MEINMSTPENKLERIQEELKWITVTEISESTKPSKGIYGILVPLGCLVTAGVLVSGVVSMFKREQKKQQLLMRYRVLAQGVTIAIATLGLFQYKFRAK